MKKKQDISPVQFLLVLLGVFAWAVAAYFASQPPVEKFDTGVASNNVSAAGVLGFAVAGGLCFLGVGVGGWKGRDAAPPTLPPQASDETVRQGPGDDRGLIR